MTGQELATAMQYGLAPKVFVIDNGTYGTIRMHQERDYPGRVVRHRPQESRLRRLRPRLRAPMASPIDSEQGTRFSVIEKSFCLEEGGRRPTLKIDTEAITPNTTISRAAGRALKKK